MLHRTSKLGKFDRQVSRAEENVALQKGGRNIEGPVEKTSLAYILCDSSSNVIE